MNFDDLRQRAAAVRAVPLEAVLILRGAVRDAHDRRKWHTARGPLSVTGSKFINWQRGQGGGGAIDLVMHLDDAGFRTAVGWLEQHLASSALAVGGVAARASGRAPLVTEESRRVPACGWRLPFRDDRLLGRIRRYLTGCRYLPASLIEPLFASGKLYADSRGNAVFVLVAGKANRPVGAELRGTGPRVWRGMAPGTHKDLGYFWIGTAGSRNIVLCRCRRTGRCRRRPDDRSSPRRSPTTATTRPRLERRTRRPSVAAHLVRTTPPKRSATTLPLHMP
jgi:hypothetical protein